VSKTEHIDPKTIPLLVDDSIILFTAAGHITWCLQ